MNASIIELAKQMNVNPIDLKAMAQSVANTIEADGIKDKFINAGQEMQIGLTEAYAVDAVKKMTSFTSIYMVRTEARESFIKSVYATI